LFIWTDAEQSTGCQVHQRGCGSGNPGKMALDAMAVKVDPGADAFRALQIPTTVQATTVCAWTFSGLLNHSLIEPKSHP